MSKYVEDKVTLDMLRDRYAARCERTSPRILRKFPPLPFIRTRAMIGGFSWSVPGWSVRLMKAYGLVNLGYGDQTPPEVARDYLMLKFHRRMRATGEQARAIKVPRHAPMFCIPGEMPDAVYIDIKSAYWSILRVTGWNLEYNPGRWLGTGHALDDFPLPENKVARNSLVTAGLTAPMRVWTGAALIYEKHGNPLTNYGVWALVQDVLNSVAREMIDYAGAVYVHTDGYIIHEAAEDVARSIIESWGLTPSVKARGYGKVRAVGSYEIGEVKTRSRALRDMAKNNVMQVDYLRWLKARFSRLATLR
jgi:hypothetical protein